MEKTLLFDILKEEVQEKTSGVFFTEGIWVHYFPKKDYFLPNYGFKIHVSATIDNIVDILKSIIPLLREEGVKFKFIKSIEYLNILNMGDYGYTQIGKACTIYPANYEQFSNLLEVLSNNTKKFSSIGIPSDFNYKCSSVVYYRYGEILLTDSSQNKLFNDTRKRVIPDTVRVPINDYYIPRLNVFSDNYKPLKCLRIRGKSSVYLSVNIEQKELCIVKKGNYLGEIDIYGRDGLDRVYDECKILKELSSLNLYPTIIDNYYVSNSLVLVQEYLQGKTLVELLLSEEEYSNEYIMKILDKIWKNVKLMHDSGYIINDLSPDNIILQSEERVKFIDAEHVVKKKNYKKEMDKIGTPAFSTGTYSREDKDLYAFLCICYFCLNQEEYITFRNEWKKQDNLDLSKKLFLNIQLPVDKALKNLVDDIFSGTYFNKRNKIDNWLKKSFNKGENRNE